MTRLGPFFISLLLVVCVCGCSGSGGEDDAGEPDALDAADGDGMAGDEEGDAYDGGGDDHDGGQDASDAGDSGPPPHPTYAANAANWAEGTPEVSLQVAVDGMQVRASGSGQDPGGISACSYNFGDELPPIEVDADGDGNCPEVPHTYNRPGGYNVVLAVWDDLGMAAQESTMVRVGGDTGASMRSGTHIDNCLETYWWTPDEGGPFPAMVHYTPYPVADSNPPSLFLASGLAVVLVTNRGQGDSCGASDLFGTVAQQDLNLIDSWLDSQAWATGDFCLWGHSGPGIMGTLSSTVAPPGLRCAFVGGGAARFYEGLFSKSGAWWPVASMWVLGTYGTPALEDADNRIPPLIDALVTGHRNTRDSDFFSARDKVDELTSLEVPILFETSWDDLAWGGGSSGGPYLDFVQDMQEDSSAMLIFPGPHPSFDPTNQRPFRTQPGRGTNYLREVRAFFIYHLLGGAMPASAAFDYRYLRLRGGVQAAWMNRRDGGWQSANRWPPVGTTPVSLYPAAGNSGTVSSRYDGFLAGVEQNEGSVEFDYSAAPVWDPVYSSGSAPWRCYTFPDMRHLDKAAVTFTSPPLNADAVVEGPVTFEFTAETGLYDFDWMIMLTDVWPDGSSHRISSGFLRASLRNGDTDFEPQPQGEQTYTVNLASFSNVFEVGHRMRLSVHQVNSTDAEPASKATILSLNGAELGLHVRGGNIELGPLQTCADCSPDAEAQESHEAYKKFYVTGGIRGNDPESDQQVAFAFVMALDTVGRSSGSMLGTLPDGHSQGGSVTLLEKSANPDYDYHIELGEQTSGFLRCAEENDPGTLLLTISGNTVGPVEVSDGSIRCYDVPFVNW